MPNCFAKEHLDSHGERAIISRASEIFFRCLTFEDEVADDFLKHLVFSAQSLELTWGSVGIISAGPKPFADGVFGKVMSLSGIGNRHAVVLNGREDLGPEFGREWVGHTLDS